MRLALITEKVSGKEVWCEVVQKWDEDTTLLRLPRNFRGILNKKRRILVRVNNSDILKYRLRI